MLSLRFSFWRARSVHPSVPYAHAQGFEGPFKIWNFYAYTEHTRKKLMRMHRVHISSWPVSLGTHQFLKTVCSQYTLEYFRNSQICDWAQEFAVLRFADFKTHLRSHLCNVLKLKENVCNVVLLYVLYIPEREGCTPACAACTPCPV